MGKDVAVVVVVGVVIAGGLFVHEQQPSDRLLYTCDIFCQKAVATTVSVDPLPLNMTHSCESRFQRNARHRCTLSHSPAQRLRILMVSVMNL